MPVCDFKNSLGARGEFLFHRHLLEGDIFRQAAFHGGLHFAFDQRSGVFHEFLVGEHSVFADPLTRNEVFDIRDVFERLEGQFPFVGVAGAADDFHHESAHAVRGGADCGLTASEGLVDIGCTGEMSGRSLGVTELHSAGLGAEFALNHFGQPVGSARKEGVAEGVQFGLIRTDLFSLGIADTFTHHHHAIAVFLDGFLDLGEDGVEVVLDLGEEDDVGRVVRASLGEDSACCDPAG